MAGDYSQARKARHGTATMTIEPAPKTFADKNLDPQLSPGVTGEKTSTDNATPGGSIAPELNAPKQRSRGTGSTKIDLEGLIKT